MNRPGNVKYWFFWKTVIAFLLLGFRRWFMFTPISVWMCWLSSAKIRVVPAAKFSCRRPEELNNIIILFIITIYPYPLPNYYWISTSLSFICAPSSIQRYAAIPLSTNSGLIGWVRHCDTLHTLIRDYRDKKKILLNIEHRIMLRVSYFISSFQ